MAKSPLELGGAYSKTTQGNVDFHYDNDGNGWADVAAACAGVPVGIRFRRTVLIDGAGEYWWKEGTTDDDLIPKSGSPSEPVEQTITDASGVYGDIAQGDSYLTAFRKIIQFISDFYNNIRATTLATLTIQNFKIVAGDSLQTAFGKLQGQINGRTEREKLPLNSYVDTNDGGVFYETKVELVSDQPSELITITGYNVRLSTASAWTDLDNVAAVNTWISNQADGAMYWIRTKVAPAGSVKGESFINRLTRKLS